MSEKKSWFAERCLGSQQGFSLLEIMVAMVILSVGILSIVGIQYHVVNGNTSGNVVTQQLNLAQRVMERYKNTVNPDKLTDEDLVNVDQTGESGGPYTVRVRVDNLQGVDAEHAQKITVTVFKSGGVGGHQSGTPLVVRSVTRGHGI